jgi:hypothetical protein
LPSDVHRDAWRCLLELCKLLQWQCKRIRGACFYQFDLARIGHVRGIEQVAVGINIEGNHP